MTSSKSITLGCMASARAMATRCCWPPESLDGYSSILSSSPTLRSSSRAMSLASDLRMPFTFTGAMMMLSMTLRCGNRLKLWKTMPTSARSSAIRRSG